MSVSEERLKDWIEKADHDLGTAIVINEHIPDYSDTLAFHCQQALNEKRSEYLGKKRRA